MCRKTYIQTLLTRSELSLIGVAIAPVASWARLAESRRSKSRFAGDDLAHEQAPVGAFVVGRLHVDEWRERVHLVERPAGTRVDGRTDDGM
jgi:hypothetical protein